MTYLLTCTSCEQPIPLEVAQAGETVRCDCGAEIPVPSMREIRRLPTDAGPAAVEESIEVYGLSMQSSPARQLQRYLFAAGFLVAVISAGMAGFYYFAAARIQVGDVHRDQMDQGDRLIDALTPEGAYEAWKMLRIQGIGDHEKPDHVLQEKKKEGYMRKMGVAYYGFAFGLLVIGIGMFLVKLRSSPRSDGPPPGP
ncbi:MAG: hypothetical protein VB855_03380 [Pirellulaceae bacterium]